MTSSNLSEFQNEFGRTLITSSFLWKIGFCNKRDFVKKPCENKMILPAARVVNSTRLSAFTSQVLAAGLFFYSFLTILPAGVACEPGECGRASWYSSGDACRYNSDKACPTASGKSLYDLEAGKEYFCASWNYPIKTKLRVTSVKSGKSVVCLVYDRGPAKRLGRIVDLSKAAFKKIADLKCGTVRVMVEVIK